MRRILASGGIVMGLALLAVTGCASMDGGAPKERSLYSRLGGRDGIAIVVDDFVVNAVADPRIGPAFKALQPAQVFRLKSNIADFVCDATGGPCAYLGRSMKESHKGLGLMKEDVAACNTALARALDKRGVAAADKAQVMKVVEGLMPDLVGQ